MPFAVLTCTARMMPSLPGYTSFSIANGDELPRLIFSFFTITAFPAGRNLVALCVRLCRPLKAVKYSLCQCLQRLSLQFLRNLARLRRSGSSIYQVSSCDN